MRLTSLNIFGCLVQQLQVSNLFCATVLRFFYLRSLIMSQFFQFSTFLTCDRKSNSSDVCPRIFWNSSSLSPLFFHIFFLTYFLCCVGNVLVLQVFGGAIHSSLLKEAPLSNTIIFHYLIFIAHMWVSRCREG